jgi:hypothetical protein
MTNIFALIFETPFSFEVSDAPQKLQHESVELQHDLILRSIFNQESVIYYLLCFSGSRQLAYNLATVSVSTYTCEPAFHI